MYLPIRNVSETFVPNTIFGTQFVETFYDAIFVETVYDIIATLKSGPL